MVIDPMVLGRRRRKGSDLLGLSDDKPASPATIDSELLILDQDNADVGSSLIGTIRAILRGV